ncbi:hypothetical protein EYR40_011021 [Pleurotus pulmonarius]|nr:hypothetical protein EYR36_002789 [Pleurotus pulmonarius]KAF4587002.1 hypothetical protein EYR40_011021 [Pleurotus pulmonarius]
MAPKASNATGHAVNLDTLHDALSTILDQAQLSVANHRKNCVALYKLHIAAAAISQPGRKGSAPSYTGEQAFGDVFMLLIGRVLMVKKGLVVGDRIVKFVGAYAKFINEKAAEEAAKHPDADDNDDTLSSRFLARLLTWLFDGFLAKNKVVRYRSVQLVSEMISHLGELDEETYTTLRSQLIDRVNDKEPIIRAHAVIALSKLVGSEDPSEVPNDEPTILITVLEVLCGDPSPEVRRAALVNIPLTAETLEVILSRTRDTDPVTRKLVYSTVLQTRLTHPRQLSIAQREQVVKHGLGDREPGTRLAAGKLVASWLDAIMVEDEAKERDEDSWVGDDGGVMRGFVAFLRIFDVVGPGEEVAVDAVQSIFVTRPEYLDIFTFSASYWKDLTAESAVLARVFIEHCLKTNGEARLETASVPVVTEFAFYVQEVYNALLRLMQEEAEARTLDDEDEQERDEREELMVKTEVILGELLAIAVKLDYADEIGRRKTLTVVRDMLAHPQLPESLIPKCMDVLQAITPSERELIRIVVEIIIEHRDGDDDQVGGLEGMTSVSESQSDITHSTIRREKSMRRAKGRDDMSPEEAMEADVIDLRCLALCIAMLERVHGDFDDNSTLQGILGDLIIPAVKRKELLMRERALISLGLCCLIAKNMALGSFQLFLNQVQNSPVDLRLKVLQLVFDLLVMYEQEFFGRPEIADRIITFLLQTLETDESPVIQAVLCIGISKLLLAGFVDDPRVLTSLILVYVSPATADNHELRQCLSYFFPVYCYSSTDNQCRLQSVFMSAYDQVVRVHEELDDGQEMITPLQFALLLTDWLDPDKTAAAQGTVKTASRNIHMDLAVDVLRALFDEERTADNQKVLCQLLSHLSMNPEANSRSLHKVHILLYYLEERRLIENTTTEKLVARFRSRFQKAFGSKIGEPEPSLMDEDDFQELFEYIGAEPKQYLQQIERERDNRPPAPAADDEDQDGGGSQAESALDKGQDETRSPATKPAKRKSATNKVPVSDSSASDSPSSEDEQEPEVDVGSDREQANMVSEPIQPESQSSQRGTPSSNTDGREVTKEGWETEHDDNVEDDDEGEVVAKPPKKVANGNKRKTVAKRTTRKVKAAPTTPDPEAPDEVPKRKAAPRARSQPKRNGRSQGDARKAAKASSSRSSGGASVPAQETPVPSDAEEDANDARPIPVTPMKKHTKRLRSPGAKQAIMSPIRKRQSRQSRQTTGAAKTRRGERHDDDDDEDDDEHGDEDVDEGPTRSPTPSPVKGGRSRVKRPPPTGAPSKTQVKSRSRKTAEAPEPREVAPRRTRAQTRST